MANRQAAESLILEYIEKMAPGSPNTQLYKDRFARMNDKQFDAFMDRLEREEEILQLIAPNFSQTPISVENNLKLAKELGHEFFERIVIDNGNEVPPYLTPKSYMVVDLPLRRQAQLLVKKISIPEDTRSVDDMTGQPTGKSKGSKISYPEVQVMAAMEMDQTLIELLKYRGGDEKGFNAMNQSISRYGGVSLERISKLGTTVKSTQTLNTFLTCMHYQVSGLVADR